MALNKHTRETNENDVTFRRTCIVFKLFQAVARPLPHLRKLLLAFKGNIWFSSELWKQPTRRKIQRVTAKRSTINFLVTLKKNWFEF